MQEPARPRGLSARSDLFDRLHKAAFTSARRIGVDHQTAEDVAQDVVIKLLERGYEHLEDPVRYAARMARNTALDTWGARKREWVSVDEDVEWINSLADMKSGPSTQATRPALFRQLLEPLTVKQRDVFLASLDGLSNAAIADQFGYAGAPAVAVTLTRIRKLIRDRFKAGELYDLLLRSPAFAALGHIEPGAERAVVDDVRTAPEAMPADVRARASSLVSEIRAALGAPTDLP